MPERGFLIFECFCYFLRNFLNGVEYERNSGLKFFFPFLGLYHPIFAKNNARKRFFNFFDFFSFFLEFSCPDRVTTEFGAKIFFFSFLAYLIPFWLKIMPKRGFLIFLIFLLFFSEFYCPSRV